MKITNSELYSHIQQKGQAKIQPRSIRIGVGMGTCGMGNGAAAVFAAFEKSLKKRKIHAVVTKVGCFGFCAEEPLVNIQVPGHPLIMLHKVKVRDVDSIVKNIRAGEIDTKHVLCKIETWDHLTGTTTFGSGCDGIPAWNEIPFFAGQKKIILRDAGLINPEDIDEYIGVGGYSALFDVLVHKNPEYVIEEVKQSKLRGRGGAGFPTGKKWELLRQARGDQKYIICNADEGDPGAFMNRNEIESDPHMLVEGMIIGGYAMGASEGVIYARAEYPLAVERLKRAIAQAEKYGIVGEHIFGTNFNFKLSLVEGAGAFVCGEETALIASIEGKAGRPRPRPPFPAQKGYLDKPTNINNVETWCNIPVILKKGAAWFCQTGTVNSSGTKVFSLVGKVKNTGLVELPLGTQLQKLVYNIGGGTGTSKKVKAIQSGGPSGGCIPTHLFTTPIDYETLSNLGAIMGSGGMVVMDEDNCMVDVAKYFTQFTTSESCGKCTPCREGLTQELRILSGITRGAGSAKDLRNLDDLNEVIRDSALCGLGQTAPNPILTTMKYFRKEYDEHIQDKRCDASVCDALFLSPCENTCPIHMNIPAFLELIKEGRLIDAFESIYRDNPLPASSGRICHFHCKLRCRREDIDEPVSQGEMHRYVADRIYSERKHTKILRAIAREKLPATKKKIAIVGGGPCGLTAAFYLVRLGHEVVLFEANEKAGGILEYGIPEYRLPKKVLQREIEFIQKLGVRFVYSHAVDTKELNQFKKTYDAVFVATGAYKNMPLGIRGEDLTGVMSGVHFLDVLARKQKPEIGSDVVIIGAGNVAIDAARSALRLGARVTIVYRREKDDMPANKIEIEEAEKEGVQFMFLLAPKEIRSNSAGGVSALQCTKMLPGEFDVSGRRRPVATDEIVDIPCSTIMIAIGEKVDAEFIQEAGVACAADGTVVVNRFTFKTSEEKIYAGGDLVMGPATAVEAMAQGKRAAETIDQMLMGSELRFSTLFKKFTYENVVPRKPSSRGKQAAKALRVSERRNNFKEVSCGLTDNQVHVETLRCLRCDVK